MHHILRGALGAAMVYPLVWYYYSQPSQVPPVAPSVARSAPSQRPAKAIVAELDEPLPSQPQGTASVPSARDMGKAQEVPREQREARSITQRVSAPAAELAPPVEPTLPGLPKVEDPKVDFPAFAEIKEALGQMKDLQGDAHDPKALEKRVQAMEDDPQKLARLKAFAEQFMELPPPRGDRYLPSGDTSRSKPAR